MNQERRRMSAIRKTLEPEIQRQQEQYAKSWVDHASHHERNGDYEWKASFTAGRRRILEIGTGNGAGTIALCKSGSTVVSIEVNPFCLQLAEKRISAAGIPVAVERRSSLQIVRADAYTTNFKKVASFAPAKGALLIEGDVVPEQDPLLTRWLTSIEPFDAIVCWEMGTQQSRYDAIKGGPKNYRLLIQNKVYDLADLILRPGGILHIVDRGGNPSDQEIDVAAEILSSHNEQAAPTSLVVEPTSLTSRPYDRPGSGTGILIGVRGEDGEVVQNDNMVFWSIIARKPALERSQT